MCEYMFNFFVASILATGIIKNWCHFLCIYIFGNKI